MSILPAPVATRKKLSLLGLWIWLTNHPITLHDTQYVLYIYNYMYVQLLLWPVRKTIFAQPIEICILGAHSNYVVLNYSVKPSSCRVKLNQHFSRNDINYIAMTSVFLGLRVFYFICVEIFRGHVPTILYIISLIKPSSYRPESNQIKSVWAPSRSSAGAGMCSLKICEYHLTHAGH